MNENQKEPSETMEVSTCCISSAPYIQMRRGCLGKIKDACHTACEGFLQARITVSYRMVMRIHKETCSSDHASSVAETEAVCRSGNMQGHMNTMAKEGNLEIRLSDLVIGMTAAMLLCTAVASVKTLIGCKHRM